MQSAAISAVLVLSVIAVLVIVLALVLYVRKLRAYFSADEPNGPDHGHLHAHRTRDPARRGMKVRR